MKHRELQERFVFAENKNVLPELCAGASTLWEKVEAIIVGSAEDIMGCAEVIWSIPAQESSELEAYTESIVELVNKEKPARLESFVI